MRWEAVQTRALLAQSDVFKPVPGSGNRSAGSSLNDVVVVAGVGLFVGLMLLLAVKLFWKPVRRRKVVEIKSGSSGSSPSPGSGDREADDDEEGDSGRRHRRKRRSRRDHRPRNPTLAETGGLPPSQGTKPPPPPAA